MKYPKINSLWKRVDGKGALIEGDYAIPEFSNIKRWQVQEKIDGTNIRVQYSLEVNREFDVYDISFWGRTDDAMIPKKLDLYLRRYFTPELMKEVFPIKEDCRKLEITLFGEGYGPGIQKGGGSYRTDQAFILFDVHCNGWWMAQDSVKDIATKLGIPYAPMIGIMTEEEIVAYVKSKPLSTCSATPQQIEGIVARPEQLLLLRNGDPLLMKLKCKEF